MALPTISIVIPTLNAGRYLAECLGALRDQDYPPDRIEIVIADGGSTDATIKIARQFGVDTIVPNPLKTGEAGKAAGIAAARHELICMVDSDNVVVGRDWLRRMVHPFADPAIASSEVLFWAHRPTDSVVNRYCALTGVNDPVCLFTGQYGRYSYLTGRWTGVATRAETDCGDYLKVELDPSSIPTLGANGYIVRRSALARAPIGEYYFDIDVAYQLAQQGHVHIARVKTAIAHYFADGPRQFARKTRRRIVDYLHYQSQGRRSYPWAAGRAGIARFVGATLLVFPLLLQAIRGYRRVPDVAWFFHIPACWLTLAIYGSETLRSMSVRARRPYDRRGWQQ